MVQIKKQIANRNNYGPIRLLSKILWIVIHYTSNDGDSDEGNGGYFQRNIVKASAHYFVDDDSITQSVPDDYVAYSVGGKKYNTAGGRLYGTVNNSNSISIELCDSVKDGKIHATDKTIANALDLVRMLMAKYGIDQAHVIRHYDVNGKPCPAYWTDDALWKKEFWDLIPERKTSLVTGHKYVTTQSLAVRSGPGGKYHAYSYKELTDVFKAKDLDKDGKIDAGKKITCKAKKHLDNGDKWIRISEHDYWVKAYNKEKDKWTIRDA